MLSKGAFNALLMTLEEPPKHVIFILATTDPDKIPDTILSRVQKYNFKRINKKVIERQLKYIFDKENVSYDEDSIEMIADLANGSLRDALSIADQINAYSNSNIIFQNIIDIFGLSTIESQVHLVNLLARKQVAKALEYFDLLVDNGIDISKFIVSLINLLKDYLVYQNTNNVNLINLKDSKILNSIILKSEVVYKILDVLINLLENVKYSDIPQQLFQLAIIKICSFEGSNVDIEKKDIYDTRDLSTSSNTINQLEINAKNANVDISTSEYRDITDEYFASPNLDQLKNTTPLETNEQIVPNVVLPNKEHETRTVLADFSNQKIAFEFNDMANDNEIFNENSSNKKSDDFYDEINKTSLLNVRDETNENIIDKTTELLNISHEQDGNNQEINESLLRDYDTNKQIFDTNEFFVDKSKASENNNINENLENETKEFHFEKNEQKNDISLKTNQSRNLSQQKIINLFLLAKKDTFDIFKKKLENASCDVTEEYSVYYVLIKEVKFICSSNDFILVSSEEDWVIEDINSKYNEPKFREFISKYFGNNIHFFAIKKEDYVVSKELLKELKKNKKTPKPTSLEIVDHSSFLQKNNENSLLNDVESKSKALFGNIFSWKKE